ncbi:MAG: asparagine synthase-related protein, partial [Bacteroidota bacterium]
EGMYLFMKYGFSAFGRTPFESLSVLRYFSALRFKAGNMVVTEKEDPALSIDLSKPAGEDEIWELIREDITQVLDQTTGVVVSPLSGGLDSRIINAMIPEDHKSRVRTFSYGISPNQAKSFESRIASNIAKKLELSWEQIFLKDAFHYMDHWHDLFGCGIHLHGMYDLEFFKKILEKIDLVEPPLMFSGNSGSAFQGGHPPKGYVNKPSGLYDLALTHGLNSYSWLDYRETEAETRFFEQNRALLSDLRWYPVITMRIKMNLLHYLYKLPDNMGISSSSPYHSFEIATKMLSLPDHRRHNRKWVNDFLKKEGLYIGNRSLFGDTRNTLNRQLFLNHKFEPVDDNILKEAPIPNYIIRRVNGKLKSIGTFREQLNSFFTSKRIVKELLKIIGIKNILNNNLFPYLVIKAVEKSVRKHS